MDKVKVLYVNQNGDKLFQETINYTRIPPVGRHIIWMKEQYKISEIVEIWDEKIVQPQEEPKIIVTLQAPMSINY